MIVNSDYQRELKGSKPFQEEEEREVMIKIAEMQKAAVSEEADLLESMPDWKARVLGLRKEDVI